MERSEDDWTKRTDRGISVLTALSVKNYLPFSLTQFPSLLAVSQRIKKLIIT